MSDFFVDSRALPKWYGFAYGVAIIFILLAIAGLGRKKRGAIPWKFDKLFLILLTCCSAQALYGTLQFVHLLSAYEGYRVTGSFENPAGFAASLCAGIPFSIYFLRDRRKAVRYYAIAVIILVCVGVTLSFSRTGIISLVIIAAIAFFDQSKTKHKAKLGLAFGGLFLCIVSVLYLVKKDSADGRLLIWRCSFEMIKDKPILGHGPGGFVANYMDYQAEYFKQYPESKYALLADNIHHPFNEYMLLIVNYGLVGFILFCVLLYWIWNEYRKRYKSDIAVRISGLSLCAILFFSLFSYPLSYPFVWVVILIGITVIFTDKYQSNRIICVAGLLIATSILVYTGRDTYRQWQWRAVSREEIKGGDDPILLEYENLSRKMANNRFFLYHYAYELRQAGQYVESIAIAQSCSVLWADYYLQLMIGDNYYQLKQYDKSEQHFRLAAAMCPVRFMPLYRIAKIYIETGQDEQAKKMAQYIIDKKVKVPSATVATIKYEMQQFISQKP